MNVKALTALATRALQTLASERGGMKGPPVTTGCKSHHTRCIQNASPCRCKAEFTRATGAKVRIPLIVTVQMTTRSIEK